MPEVPWGTHVSAPPVSPSVGDGSERIVLRKSGRQRRLASLELPCPALPACLPALAAKGLTQPADRPAGTSVWDVLTPAGPRFD